ncbi:MAG: high-potential iron-sulfur protein [Gammaproteobacteria bacterium]|nr:high-potential iron-sulfur protein [Pseudomonadales bacterium]MCP5347846.1 high-potential iron-sulfur protein [Pseudomonadales bacterium]
MTKSKSPTGRRLALIKLGILGTLSSFPGTTIIASTTRQDGGNDDLPHLREDDQRARALAYTDDAETASARSDDSAYCHNCRFYAGDGAGQWAACSLFPGQAVNVDGWCKSWVAKTG